MKKGLTITLVSLAGILLLLALAPFLFKDKIKEKLDSEIAKSLNAQVYYNIDKFSLGIFRNFPNLTLTLGEFGMLGKAEGFEGDTLLDVNEFSVVLDIMSVISGDKIKVKSIYLNQPYILTQYKKDGKFSWDITFPDSSAAAESSAESSAFAVNIERWEIENGTLIYDDQTMPFYAKMTNLNHTGKGDITEAIYDVSTYTKASSVTVVFDGITYLNNVLMEAKADLNINMNESNYTFKENEFTINNFKVGFDGVVAMPDTNILVDITYAAKETSFKNLISLVPAVYTKDYEQLKTDGTIAFNGYAKGVYNAITLPAFGLALKVTNAMMQYPELPTAMNNINLDLNIECKDGIIDHTIIDLKKFHVDMGTNPVDMEAYVNGLNPYDIQKCNISAQVKLEELTQLFPIDSLALKGLFALSVKAKGKYSDELKLMPDVKASATLKDGYVKSEAFLEALESVNMSASVNSNGNMVTSAAVLDYLKFTLDKEPFELAANVLNFDDPNYEARFKGLLDLAKLTKLFPIEGTTLSGKITTDLKTKGVMSDVTEGRYGKTSTAGTMDIKGLSYLSVEDLPQGFGLSTAMFVFSPEKIDISEMKGTLGNSDLNVVGYFSNYMGYLFGGKDTTLHGKMVFKSAKFDVNEWMTEDSTVVAATPVEPSTALEIPKNIDFYLTSAINQVLYDNLVLSNLVGDIIVKGGIVTMKGVNFGLLEGAVAMNGFYNAVDLSKPTFDFDMDVSNMAIKEAFKSFATIQTFAPMAETTEGKFSTVLKLKGGLTQEMMPDYATLSGNGVLAIASASVKGNKVLGGVASLTKMQGLDPLAIKDLKIKYKIEDGKLKVEPFDLNAGNVKMNLGGANSFDGGLDYKLKLDMPAGVLGAAVNNVIGNLTGKPVTGSQSIKLNFGIGGTMAKPKIVPEGGSTTDAVTDTKTAVTEKAKAVVTQEVDKAKAELEARKKVEEEKLRAEEARIKAELEAKKKAEEERLKKEAENKAKDALKKIKF